MNAPKVRKVVTAVFTVECDEDDAEPLTLLLTDITEMCPSLLVSLSVEQAPVLKLDLSKLNTSQPTIIGPAINALAG